MPSPILALVEAATIWPLRGALLGLDLGTKTIGVSVSDPDRRVATGVETIRAVKFTQDAARLLALASERNAVGLCSDFPSTWMEAKVHVRNRPARLRATSRA